MKGNQKFFKCEKCGNFLTLIESKGGPLTCCGVPLKELVANTEEASVEKHLPDVKITANGIDVAVGSVLHPMTEEHHIQFIYVETDKGGQFKHLGLDEEPVKSFTFTNEKPVAVYEYCNLHGLWKTEL